MTDLFDPRALEGLAVAVRGATPAPALRLRLGTPSAFAARLAAAASDLAHGTGGALALHREASPDPGSVLVVEVAGREAIHYQAVPEGPEAAPFLEALLALAGDPRRPEAPVRCATSIEVFIAPSCPNCPQAVRAAIALAVADPLVAVTVIDADEHRGRAEEMRLQSVPTTVVDGGLTVVGVLSADELARRIALAGGAQGKRAVLASQLDAGRFSAASRLLSDAAGQRAFAELWLASTLETRIGLLLAVEETLERDADSLDGAVARLLPGLQAVDVALRGDTVDLLGRIGHPTARPDLELLLRDPVADVREAAREALASLRDGGGAADAESRDDRS